MNAEQELPASAVPDVSDVPLDDDTGISDEECALLLRQIGLAEGEPVTSVSAFNSSI